MESGDELRRLRHDLDEVIGQTENLSRRLEKLEASAAPATPPPLPIPPPTQPVLLKSLAERLHDAARRGDIALARRCLDEGADINVTIAYETPLDAAIEAGQFEMVRFLVNSGARIDHDSFIGKSHIRRAKSLERADIVEFLQQQRSLRAEAVSASARATDTKPGPVSPPKPKPDLWAALANAPGVRQIREYVEGVRKRTQEVGWEVQLGTYWLPRIAVLCIAIAVVFFLSLAINRWGAQWLPHLRIGIGYAVCAGLLAMAWRAESKYSGLARVLYGGGFAVMYFVTFATHYIPFARIFASPAITLILLAIIVIAWGVAAQIRQSKVIAFLVTALGHLTIMLSTLTLDHAASFSTMGILFLSAGSAFFLLRNRWYYVGTLGMLLSYGNDVVVLANSRGGNPYTDFAGSMGVLSVFLLMFMLAELLASKQVRESVPTWFRTFFVTVNTAAFTVIGTIIMNNFAFTRPHMDWFRFGLAALLALMALAYLRLRAGDALHNAYFTMATISLTLGLAAHYNGGPTFAAWLAVEMVALLVSARRTGLVVMRILAFGAACLAFQQALANAVMMTYPAHVRSAFLSAFAFLVVSVLYQKTDWTTRSPKSAPFGTGLLNLLWKLDLIAEPPEPSKDLHKPLGGLFFPYLFAAAGTILFVSYILHYVPIGRRFEFASLLAFALTFVARFSKSKPLGLMGVASLVLLSAVFGTKEQKIATVDGMPLFLMSALAGPSKVAHPHNIDLMHVILGWLCCMAVALNSEERFNGRPMGLEFHQKKASPYLMYGVCAWLAGLFLVFQCFSVDGAVALACAAVVSAALVLVLHSTALACIAGAFACAAGFFALWINVIFLSESLHHSAGDLVRYAPRVAIVVGISLLLDRYFALFKKRTPVAPYVSGILVVNAAAVLGNYLESRFTNGHVITAFAYASVAFLVYGAVFRSTTAHVIAVAGMLYASLRCVGIVHTSVSAPLGLETGAIVLTALALLFERYFHYRRERFTIAPYLCAAFVVGACVVLLSYFEIGISRQWLMTATALAGYGFLAYALVFRSPTAGVVSVAAILYASFRHSVAAFEADSLQPGVVHAFVLLAAFWILLERLYVWLLPRFDGTLQTFKDHHGFELRRPENALIPISLAVGVLLIMLNRIPHLAAANLALITIGWFALAAGLFVASLIFRQHLYRYTGLEVIVLSLGRLFLVDMKEQDPLLRVAAFAVVGGGLLCISVGYYKWMARTRASKAHVAETGSE